MVLAGVIFSVTQGRSHLFGFTKADSVVSVEIWVTHLCPCRYLDMRETLKYRLPTQLCRPLRIASSSCLRKC
jgi:hypothetical protein